MTRRRHDHEDDAPRSRTLSEQLGGTMFDETLTVAHRDVRIDPPSAPGSESSERGATAAKHSAKSQEEGILAILARLPEGVCLSRDEIIARYGPKLSVNAACGRLDTLAKTLQHVEVIEGGAMSEAGNRVNGYRLSETGRRRVTINGRRSA